MTLELAEAVLIYAIAGAVIAGTILVTIDAIRYWWF